MIGYAAIRFNAELWCFALIRDDTALIRVDISVELIGRQINVFQCCSTRYR